MTKALLAFALLAASAFAQTATTFSLNLTPIALPGGKTTLAGADAGVALAITPRFTILDENILATDLKFFGGGVQINLPVISTKLNNASPNLNGLAFQFYLKSTFGMVQLPSANHYGFTAGGGVNYFVNNNWAFGGEVRFANFPGYNSRTMIASVGPSLHF